MAKVREHFNLDKTEGLVGIEIEMEGSNFPNEIPFWRKEVDPSLRGDSAEYVLKKPMNEEHLFKAFNALEEKFSKSGTKVFRAYRAGTHIHINVQELQMTELLNFIFLYYIFEDLLINFCEESRQGNHFCLRLKDAEYVIDLLYDAIIKEDLRILETDNIRYSSLNLNSLFKYGSLEFRALESTIDWEKLKNWIKLLLKLKEKSSEFRTPAMIMSYASGKGFTPFAEDIFGDLFPLIKKGDVEALVRGGIRRTQLLAYSKDWEKVNKNIFVAKNLFTPLDK